MRVVNAISNTIALLAVIILILLLNACAKGASEVTENTQQTKNIAQNQEYVLRIEPAKLKLSQGRRFFLTPLVTDLQGAPVLNTKEKPVLIQWSSSDDSIIEVNQQGEITSHETQGQAEITATIGDLNASTLVSAAPFTDIDEVTLSPARIAIDLNSRFQFNISAADDAGSPTSFDCNSDIELNFNSDYIDAVLTENNGIQQIEVSAVKKGYSLLSLQCDGFNSSISLVEVKPPVVIPKPNNANNSNFGAFTSLVKSEENIFHLASYDSNNNKLIYTQFDGVWSSESLDGVSDYGRFSRIALDPSNQHRPVVCALEDVFLSCWFKQASGIWQKHQLEQVVNTNTTENDSTNIGLVIDDDGQMAVSFYNAINGQLVLARSESNARSNWSRSVVTDQDVRHHSLAITPNGELRLALQRNELAFYAQQDVNDTWIMELIDADTGSGFGIELRIGVDNRPQVVYSKNGNLIYAYKSNLQWQRSVIASVNSNTHFGFALDTFAQARVSFYDTDADTLRYAMHLRDPITGNFKEWHIEQPSTQTNIGQYSYMIVDEKQRGTIAYYSGINQSIEIYVEPLFLNYSNPFSLSAENENNLNVTTIFQTQQKNIAQNNTNILRVEPASLKLAQGNEFLLKPIITDLEGNPIANTVDNPVIVTWASSDESIISVDESGVLSSHQSEGEIEITAYFNDLAAVVSVSASLFSDMSAIDVNPSRIAIDLESQYRFEVSAVDNLGAPTSLDCSNDIELEYNDNYLQAEYIAESGSEHILVTGARKGYSLLSLACDGFRSSPVVIEVKPSVTIPRPATSEQADFGIDVALTVNRSGEYHIASFDQANAKLIYTYFNRSWTSESLDGVGVYGRFAEIALDPNTNQPAICALEDRFISCWFKQTTGVWTKRQIQQVTDSANRADYFTDIGLVIDDQGVATVSFYDQLNSQLMVSSSDGDHAIWSNSVVATNGGQYHSISLTPSGQVRLALQTNDQAFYAQQADTGLWQLELIDSDLGAGSGIQMQIGNDNRPQLVYFKNGNIIYAKKSNQQWQTSVVDTVETNNIFGFAIDQYFQPHISYYDATQNTLKYADRIVNRSGGQAESWRIEKPSANDNVGRYSDLSLDVYGRSTIAYYDAQNEKVLFYVEPHFLDYTPPQIPPADIPANVDVSNVFVSSLNNISIETSNGTRQVAWNAVNDNLYYNLYLYRLSNQALIPVDTIQVDGAANYQFHDLENGVEYQFRLSVITPFGESNLSDLVSFSPLEVPAQNVKIRQWANTNTITWDAVVGSTQYYLFQQDLNNPGSTPVRVNVDASQTTSIHQITSAQNFSYAVVAANQETAAIPDVFFSVPDKPSATQISLAGSNRLQLNWQTQATQQYDVYVANTSNFEPSTNNRLQTNIPMPFNHNGLNTHQRYFYIIGIRDQFGSSNFSEVLTERADILLSDINFHASVRTCVNANFNNPNTIYSRTVTQFGCSNSQIATLSGLETLINLTDLIIDTNTLGDSDSLLNAMRVMPNLDKVNLNFNWAGVNQQLLALVNQFSQLTELNISGITNQSWRTILTLLQATPTPIQTLSIENASITNFSGMSSLVNLQTLRISNHAANLDLANLVSGIQNSPGLLNLTLANNRIQSISSLAPLQSLNLAQLDLSGNEFSDVATLQTFTSLQNLSLAGNPVRTGVTTLTSLSNLQNLNMQGALFINCDDAASLSTTLGNGVLSGAADCAVRTSDYIASLSDTAFRSCLSNTGVTYARYITTLNCPNAGIRNITGIAGLLSLTTVDLSDNLLTNVTGLGVPTEITSMKLNNTGVNNAAWNEIQKLDNLQILELNNNNISNTTLLAGQLNNLQRFLMADNPGANLATFTHISTISYLDLSRTPTSNINVANSFLPLTDLYIASTTPASVASTTHDFRDLDQLVNLDASNNKLTETIFYGLVENLNLENNQLTWTSLPQTLITADLSDNRMDYIDVSFLPNLQILDVSNNEGRDFGGNPVRLNLIENLSELTSVVELNLSGADLVNPTYPASPENGNEIDIQLTVLRAKPNSLRRLYLDNTHSTAFREASDGVGSFNLTHLSLRNSGMTVLPNFLTPMNNLIFLDLSNNSITTNSSNNTALASMDSVEELYINNANLSAIPNVAPLSGLRILEMANNNSTASPMDLTVLQTMNSLVELDLTNNNISNISPLSSKANLQRLILSANSIATIPNFSANTGLRTLDLSFNNIADATPVHSLANTLQWLSLRANAFNSPISLEPLSIIPFTDFSDNVFSFSFSSSWTTANPANMFNITANPHYFVTLSENGRLDVSFSVTNTLNNGTPGVPPVLLIQTPGSSFPWEIYNGDGDDTNPSNSAISYSNTFTTPGIYIVAPSLEYFGATGNVSITITGPGVAWVSETDPR